MPNTDAQTMLVSIFTHGKHDKGGMTAETYDGELTIDGQVAVETSPGLPYIRRMIEAGGTSFYRGQMIRHRKTVDELEYALRTKTVWTPEMACGDDMGMFALIERGDENISFHWFAFLLRCWKKSEPQMVVVTSRLFPCMMLFYQLGRAKFGGLRGFINACDELANTPGAIIPVAGQAHLTQWEVTFPSDSPLDVQVKLIRA